MAISRALFAGDDPTPDSVKKRMAIAELLRQQGADTSHVDSPLEAVGSLLSSFGGAVKERRAQADNNAGLARRSSAQQALAAGLLGGGNIGASTGMSMSAGATAQMGAAAPSQAAVIPAGDRASYIRSGLISRGLPEHIADAFLVNFKDESGLDPGINEANPTVPGSRGGFGLYQLTGPRRTAYEAFASQRGVNPGDIDPQLDFLMGELQGSEQAAGQRILSAPDTATAAQAIVNDFLRPAPQHRTERSQRYAGLGSQQPVQVASTDPTAGVAQATGGAPAAQPVAPNQQVAQLLTQGAPQPPRSAMSGVSREQIAQLLADPYTEDLGQQLLQQVLADEQARQQAGYKASLDRAETLEKRAYDDSVRREGYQREDLREAGADADRDRDFAFRVEQGSKPPTSVQEYEYARSQGFTGSFGEWETQNRKASANTVSVNTGEGDKFYENLDRKNAERFATLSDGSQNARGRQAQVDQLDVLLKQSPSGIEAAAKTWLGDMGIATEGLNSLQASVALIEKMVPEQREPGSGPMSDADIAGFRRSLPRTINQPGGNELIIGRLRAINEYDISRGEIADMVADRAITPAEGRKRLRELANPLDGFTEEVRKLGEKAEQRVSDAPQTRMVDGVPVGAASIPRPATAGQGADPVQIQSEEEFLALPSGATFISPDGRVRRKP